MSDKGLPPSSATVDTWAPLPVAAPLPAEAIDLGVELLAARDAVAGLEAEVGALRARAVDLEDQLVAVERSNIELTARAELEWARAEELEITSRHFHRLALSMPGRTARVLFRPFRKYVVD
jgi:hypothetical protein